MDLASDQRIAVDLAPKRKEIREVARLRAEHPNNVRADQMGKTSYGAHIMGACGEAAVALHYEVYDEWHGSLVYGRGDVGIDVVHSNGTTIQVKSKDFCQYRPFLILDPKLSDIADIFMMVLVAPQTMRAELAGWLPTSELKAKPMRKLRGDMCHVAYEPELRRCSPNARGV
jgi:hypothetical protein